MNLRDVDALMSSLESLQRLANSELKEMRDTIATQQRLAARIKLAAGAVIKLRDAGDTEFRSAVTVLVSDILGPDAWDSSASAAEVTP